MKKTLTSFGIATLAGLGFAVLCLVLFSPEVSKLSGESEAAVVPAPVFYLPTLISVVLLPSFNHDFETGDLTNWTRSERDTAFLFQPTFGDNPTARKEIGECQKLPPQNNFQCALEPSNHQGDWWHAGLEKYQGPNDPFLKTGKGRAQEIGGLQGSARSGEITSMEFKIVGERINFLMGGSQLAFGRAANADPPGGPNNWVNLQIRGVLKDDYTVTGDGKQTMRRREWEVGKLKGETATINVGDKAHGYTNFDDVHQARSTGKEIPWAVTRFGKLPTTFGQVKSGRL